MRRDFPLCLDLGCHDGLLTGEFARSGKVGKVVQADPAPEFAARAAAAGPPVAVEYDRLPFAEASFDAVFSACFCIGLTIFRGWRRSAGF